MSRARTFGLIGAAACLVIVAAMQLWGPEEEIRAPGKPGPGIEMEESL